MKHSLAGWLRHRTVGTKLLILILPIIIWYVSALTWYFAWHRDMARVEESARQQAQMVATQLMADRAYYTQVIVPLITALGGQLAADYHQVPQSAPLPATFVREVSTMTRSGHGNYTTELISPWPINKQQGIRDPFQQAAFAHLEQFRDGIYSRIEVADGRRILRFLKADLASAEACVSCHNAHPDSPRHDFKLNDVMGGLEVRIPIDSWLVKVRRDEALMIMWGTGICFTLIGVIWYGVHRIVTKPLGVLTRLMRKLLSSSGELPRPSSLDPEPAEPTDEVKALWKAFAEMEQIIKRQHGELRWTNARLKEQVAGRTEQFQKTLHEWLRMAKGAAALVHTAPLPIVITRMDGRIAAINAAALRGFGYEEAAVLGGPITDLIAETDWQRAVGQLGQPAADAHAPSNPASVQLQGLRKGGKRFLVELALSVIEQDGEQRILVTMADMVTVQPTLTA
jgi:PAS domain S-box-containing protein